MKKIVVVSAGLTLVACSGADEAETVPEDEVVAVEEVSSSDPSAWMTADEVAGSYSLVYDDGTEGVLNLSADGTSDGVIGGEDFAATFTVTAPGTVCYENLEGEIDLPPQCWVNSAAEADGTWTATGDDGTTVVVTPIE